MELNQIIQGDCLEIMREMPDKSVDLVLTDPPYGLGTNIFGPANKSRYPKEEWNKEIPIKAIFDEIYRISKNRIIWGVNYFGGAIKEPGRIVHYKRNEKIGYCITNSQCDLASQSFDNTIKYFEYLWDGNRQGDEVNWKNSGADARIHPTQKPLALMLWCLEKFTVPGQLVLDCFSGSGTTAIACHERNLDFICIEKEANYVELSRKRLEAARAQLELF